MFRFVLDPLKPYKFEIAIIIFLAVMVSLFEGVSAGLLVPLLGILNQQANVQELPVFFRILVNLFTGYPFLKQFILIVIAIVGAVLLKNLFQALANYFNARLQTQVTANIRKQGVNLLLEVAIGFFSSIKAGDIAERINEQSKEVGGIIKSIIDIIANLIIGLVLFCLLFALSWKLTFVAFISAFIITFLLNGYVKYLATRSKRNALATAEFSASLFEMLMGIRLIKAYSKESEEEEKVIKTIEYYKKSKRTINFGGSLIGILSETLGVILLGVIAIISIGMLKVNEISPVFIPKLITFCYIFTRIIPKVQAINRAKAYIAGKIGHATMVKEFLDRHDKPFIKNGSLRFRGFENEIRFSHVTFSYGANQNLALRDVSFVLPKGKTVAFVGESGAGKSTIVNLLLRFYDPEEGNITIDGRRLSEYDIKSYRSKFGIVSQDTFIFDASARENIAFSGEGKVRESAIIEAAKRANAHDFIMQLPQGYDTILGDRGIKLSGGQRQRISIAQAILRNPDILILDEATSFLDSITEKLIQEAMEGLSKGRTVIVIAHRLSTIEKADQIIVLKQGNIVEAGTHLELLKLNGYYDNFYKEQYRLALKSQ